MLFDAVALLDAVMLFDAIALLGVVTLLDAVVLLDTTKPADSLTLSHSLWTEFYLLSAFLSFLTRSIPSPFALPYLRDSFVNKCKQMLTFCLAIFPFSEWNLIISAPQTSLLPLLSDQKVTI